MRLIPKERAIRRKDSNNSRSLSFTRDMTRASRSRMRILIRIWVHNTTCKRILKTTWKRRKRSKISKGIKPIKSIWSSWSILQQAFQCSSSRLCRHWWLLKNRVRKKTDQIIIHSSTWNRRKRWRRPRAKAYSVIVRTCKELRITWE